MLKMIPCKECLKYALCRYKRHIVCVDLVTWYGTAGNSITKHFPNATTLSSNQKGHLMRSLQKPKTQGTIRW